MNRQRHNSAGNRVKFALSAVFCLFIYVPGALAQQRPYSQEQQARAVEHAQQNQQHATNSFGRPDGQQHANNMQRPKPLSDWFMRHQNLSSADQQKALTREPGFNQLPQETQSRLLNRLNKLDGMPADQRQRFLLRAEAMESLPPQEKQQVVQSGAQLKEMPSERQALVRKAFQDLRSIPPDQRDAVLRSQRFAGVFNPHERVVLSNLLRIEPYTPPRGASRADEGILPAGR